MKNKLFSFGFIIGLGLFSFLNSLFAGATPVVGVGTGTTVTGLDYVYVGKGGVRIVRFDAYLLGSSSSYVYNDSGSSTPSDAGAYNVLNYRFKSVRIDITGLSAAGTTTLSIQHADGTTTTWSEAAVITYTGTASASFPISEDPEFQRLGVKYSNGTATIRLTETYLP